MSGQGGRDCSRPRTAVRAPCNEWPISPSAVVRLERTKPRRAARGRLARAHADSVDDAEPNEVILVWLVVIHSLEIVNISMNVGLRGFFG